MLLIDYFDKAAALFPERAYVVEGDLSRTYEQARLASHRIAAALAAAGVAEGARAAVYCQNGIVAAECLLGIVRRGCIWVSANVRNPVDDTVHVLGTTETEALFYSRAYAQDVASIRARCPSVRLAVCVDGDDQDAISLDAFIAGRPDAFDAADRTPDDVVTLFNSGGTTGAPKGVMMTNNAWSSLVATIFTQNNHPAPVHLVAAPMTHAAGGFILVLASMGATNVMLPGFEPTAVMEAIQTHRVTHLFLPPTAIYRMLTHPDVRKYDYSSLRYFTYAGAPMSPDKVKEAIAVFGPVMGTGFGQTEAGLNVTWFSPEDHMAVIASGDDSRLLSCGRVSPFVRVEIMNENGELLPRGDVGEIVVRGGQIMKGYWNNPDETRRACAFGWHHTGDVGYLDAEGWLFLVDRKRDMIISGGFNVFPAEVEKVVVAHPAIQDCIVVGAPDPDWGEIVTAVVQLRDGAVFDADDLRDFCRSRLGGVKTPKKFEIWEELPRSPVGKLLRRKVREHYWKDRARAI